MALDAAVEAAGGARPDRAVLLPDPRPPVQSRRARPRDLQDAGAGHDRRSRTPKRSGTAKTILPAGDVARGAQVERGADAQLFDRFNPFYDDARVLGLPLAAGISGSTADFIKMAQTAGLDKAELQSFAMATIYYLVLPGHHSFHEVVTVLAAAGIVSYQPAPGVGDYAGPLTEGIRRSNGYKRLSGNYPGLLQPR